MNNMRFRGEGIEDYGLSETQRPARSPRPQNNLNLWHGVDLWLKGDDPARIRVRIRLKTKPKRVKTTRATTRTLSNDDLSDDRLSDDRLSDDGLSDKDDQSNDT